MAVFDATALIHLLEPNASAIIDPATRRPIADAKARLDQLVDELEARGERIVIPTPALSEVLVHANDATANYLEILNNSSRFRIAPFDDRAAVELACIVRESQSDKRLHIGSSGTRAALKFDRQILAIARVQNEATVYSDDADMHRLGGQLGIEVIRTYELPPPIGQQQTSMFPSQ